MEANNKHTEASDKLSAEHLREIAILALLLAASLGAAALGEATLAATLGGAGVALILPSKHVGVLGRAGVVLVAGGLASVVFSGCAQQPFPARSACRAAATLVSMACEHVPETMGGESEVSR